MRNLPLTALTFLIATSTVTDILAQRRGRRDRGSTQELSQFTHKTVEFPAPSTRGSGTYGIYLPKGYADKKNAQRTYPLVIWLHGMRGSSRRFRSGGSSTLDKMRKAGKIPDLILVTPSASSRPTYIDRGRGQNEESLILKDLMAHVEKSYRVAKERHRRAIMGVSMGALGAMKMALKYPKLFGTVAVHSSPILTVDPDKLGRYRRFASQIFGDPIDKKEWAKEIPIAILSTKKPKDLAGLRIYFDAGSNDRYGFGPTNVEFSKQLKKSKFKHTFNYIKGGGHSWGTDSIQRAMQMSFPFVAKGFAGKPAEKTVKKPTEKPKAVKGRQSGAGK
jgi:enterochelin esterase family protein